MIADWFGLVCGLRFAVCGFRMAALIRCGDLPMRKLPLLRSQLVVNTTRRSFKYGRGDIQQLFTLGSSYAYLLIGKVIGRWTS